MHLSEGLSMKGPVAPNNIISSQMQLAEDAASELRHISRHLNASFVILSPYNQFESHG